MSQIMYKKGSEWSNLILDTVYPVGSLYMSTNSTSPASLFGGTWVTIEDRMIIGASSTYAVDSTGGSSTTTISSANLPTHTHSVGAHSHGLNSHKHSVGAHAHGLNSHTHTYAKVDSPTGGTAITVAQMPSHSHGIKIQKCGKEASGYGLIQTAGFSGRPFIDSGNADWNTESAGSGKTHTHTTSTTSTNSGGPSTTNTANSTAFDSGAASGNTANSSAFESGNGGFANSAMTTISPYYAAYIWKRTA